MNVQNIRINSESHNYKKAPAFTATPEQVYCALKALGAKQKLLSPKISFLEEIAQTFMIIKSKFKYGKIQFDTINFDFKLGQRNQIPSDLASIISYSEPKINLEQMDKILSEPSPFHDALIKGETKGGFFKRYLKELGIPNPDVITISKQTQLH